MNLQRSLTHASVPPGGLRVKRESIGAGVEVTVGVIQLEFDCLLEGGGGFLKGVPARLDGRRREKTSSFWMGISSQLPASGNSVSRAA